MNLSHALAERILQSQPDAAARDAARTGVQDFLAVSWPVLQQQVPDSGLPALRQVYGDGSVRSQALLLGYAGHALDYDDFHADFRGHPSVAILPALFAWQQQPATAEAFLDAYVIGVEVAGRLGLAASQQHYALGYHNTATLGTLAAAAALARLLQLNATDCATLIGIAATQASGLRAQFGSAVKPLHAGLAAERAVMAAQLTLAKFDGRHEGVIDAFLAASSNGEAQPQRLVENWGVPWRISTPGWSSNPFPPAPELTALPKRHDCCGAPGWRKVTRWTRCWKILMTSRSPSRRVAISRRQFACRLTASKHALAWST